MSQDYRVDQVQWINDEIEDKGIIRALLYVRNKFKSGFYDDISDDMGIKLGHKITSMTDQIADKSHQDLHQLSHFFLLTDNIPAHHKEPDGSFIASSLLLQIFNKAYVHGGEIRDENSPLNNIIFKKMKEYSAQAIESQHDKVEKLLLILDLIKQSKYSRTNDLLKRYVDNVFGGLQSQFNSRAENKDENILNDLKKIVISAEVNLSRHYSFSEFEHQKLQPFLQESLTNSLRVVFDTHGYPEVYKVVGRIIAGKDDFGQAEAYPDYFKNTARTVRQELNPANRRL